MNKTFHERGFDDYIYWRHNGAGYSRRIDDTNRLVYDIENDTIIVKTCRGHY